MSMSMVVVKDRSITFPLRRGYITGRSLQHISLDGFYTPHGFVVCYWRPSAMAMDYIAGRPFARDETVSGTIAVVVTHEGHVYSLLRMPKSEDNAKGSPYVLTQLPIGEGYQFIDTYPFGFSDSVAVAIRMNHDKVDHAITDLNRIWGIYGESYITLTVDEIAAELVKRGFTKPICLANPYRTRALE